jgi:Yip1 domain
VEQPSSISPGPVATASKHLLARAAGVVLSPRSTYASIVAQPKVLGALALVVAIGAMGTIAFLSTQVGQQAALDQQVRQTEAFGRPMTDAQYAQMERLLPYFGYIGAAGQAISLVVISLIIAGLMFAIFNAILGGDATFKQVWAVVAHSGFVFSLQQLFVLPLDYVRESLTSPTTLSVFAPFLEEKSFAARLLGALDLFVMWWIVNLAIGLAVLYKRRTGPIATGLFITYVAIALIYAAVRTALSGS